MKLFSCKLMCNYIDISYLYLIQYNRVELSRCILDQLFSLLFKAVLYPVRCINFIGVHSFCICAFHWVELN